MFTTFFCNFAFDLDKCQEKSIKIWTIENKIYHKNGNRT